MKKLLITVLATIAIAGCSTKIGEYSIMSSRNIDITHSKNFSRGEIVHDSDSSFLITIFALGNTPDVNQALSKAIDQDRCTVALTDVSIYHNYLWLIYFGVNDVTLKGRQLIDTTLPGCGNRR